MNRRLLVVMLAVLTALGVLAFLLARTPRDGEPPSGRTAGGGTAASQPSDSGAAAPLPKFSADPSSSVSSDAPEPGSLQAAAGRVRVTVAERATRMSDVDVTLVRDGRSERRAKVDAVHEWPDVAPGTWQVELFGNGWSASPDQFDLASGQTVVVEVRPTNGLDGILVSGRNGHPVKRATFYPEFLTPRGESATDFTFLRMIGVDVTAPDGRFAVVGINGPTGDMRHTHLRIAAIADGLLEGLSDPLPLQPTPFWSGVVIAMPEPVLTGRVLGVDPPGEPVGLEAYMQIVDASVTLADTITTDWMTTFAAQDESASFDMVESDAKGEFAFGPQPDSPPVLTVKVLASAKGWMPALSEPIRIDQSASAATMELVLHRGGSLLAKVRVPRKDGEIEGPPISVAESLSCLAEGDGPPRARFFAAPARIKGAPGSEPAMLFEFDMTGVPAGRWRLSAFLQPADAPEGSNLGKQILTAVVDIHDGERTEVELALEPDPAGATITGTARLPPDFLADRADCVLVAAPIAGTLGPPIKVCPMGADGSFTMGGAPPGEWTLVLHASTANDRDLAMGTAFVKVEASSPPPLHVDLSRPEVRISGSAASANRTLRLSGKSGDAVFDAIIARGRVKVVTDANGDARLFGVLPGHWILTADGEPHIETAFEITAGANLFHVDLP